MKINNMKINNIYLVSCIVMDSPSKFINLNTPIINLIKFLTVANSFILAAPIFLIPIKNQLATVNTRQVITIQHSVFAPKPLSKA
jgi:hypothetical protein